MKLRILTLLALTTTAFAQTSKSGTVEGKVINSATNEPIRKVDLTLITNFGDGDMEEAMAMLGMAGPDAPAPPKKPETKSFKIATDSSGKFRFESVDPGDYFLKAVHAGFGDEHYKPASREGTDGKLHIVAGSELNGIVIRMTPHGAVSGRVQDEDGDPVPNAMVTAMTYSYATGHRTLTLADSGTSNDRGEFRLGKLRPGHYYITANSLKMDPTGTPPPPPKDGTPETGYVTTYYPNTTDASAASVIDVKPAADLSGFNIQLRKSKVVRIKGQALGSDGAPLKGGQVMLMSPANMGSMQMGMLGKEGKFELANVQPGAYTLMSIQMGGSKPSITMQAVLVPEDGLANVKLGAQDDKTIQGKVVVAGDRKVELKGLAVMLGNDENAPSMPAFGNANELGAFTLKVKPGAYPLQLPSLPPGTYLKSVLLNGRESLGKPLDFSNGAGDLVITLGTDGGQVDATVSLSDKPLFDATAVLLPADAARRFPEATKSASTDDHGHVVLKDVPPGDYLVLAWEKIEEGEWFDPALLKAAEQQAEHITLDAKGASKVQLKAIPRG